MQRNSIKYLVGIFHYANKELYVDPLNDWTKIFISRYEEKRLLWWAFVELTIGPYHTEGVDDFFPSFFTFDRYTNMGVEGSHHYLIN